MLTSEKKRKNLLNFDKKMKFDTDMPECFNLILIYLFSGGELS